MSTTVTFAHQTFFVYAVCQYYAAVGLGLSVLSLIINAAVPEKVATYDSPNGGPFVRRSSTPSKSPSSKKLPSRSPPADEFYPASVFASVTVEPRPKKSSSRPLRLSQLRRASLSSVDTIIGKFNDAGKKIAFANLKLNKGITKRLRSSSSASLPVPAPKMELKRSETI
ncbi:hypothetical protein ONZ45_g13302 [Pleurotus djamor]|nr:hypothetical protein ONZ45_g13302 [Pleurotus djamor]